MKITDVKVTVWEWKDIPPTRYTLNVKSSGTHSTHMALVRIITDEGIEGHAFLGNALSSLGNDANTISKSLPFSGEWVKPVHPVSDKVFERYGL